AKTIDAVVYTINGDMDNEIILPSAFNKRLANYKRNPIFIWAHDQRDPRNYLGTADTKTIAVTPGVGLSMRFDCAKV
ncbi:hypothetical protein ACTUM1_15825, partial [Listeria monocytogenes]|uniref:hypothetical protein n=1 Tax=Listeria monocytogenes TaxID=1639 RepID=UPI003FA4063E